MGALVVLTVLGLAGLAAPHPATSLHATSAASSSSPTGAASSLSFPYQPLPQAVSSSYRSGPGAFSTSPPPLLPRQFRSSYGVDALLNASGVSRFPVNETIAVVAWGYGYDPSDLSTFFGTYYPSNFPVPKVIPVPIDGAPPPGVNAPNDPSGGSQELTIDIEWASSMAPGATIYAIYAPPTNSTPYSPTDAAIEDALHYAVAMGNLTALSMSFGEAQGSDPSLESAMNTDFASLIKNGTTVLSSSGDDGGSPNSPLSGPCSRGPGVDFPAASPYVLAVGGTDATGGGTETTWVFSGGGSASSSANDPAPSWQTMGSAGSLAARTGTRGVPDVSANANDSGFYFNSRLSAGMGTSFSSPLWAGVVADLASADHATFGLLDSKLYALGAIREATGIGLAPFTDITHGANCYEPARPGWDPVTGWGTPNALALAQLLQGTTFTQLGLSFQPSQGVSAGATVTASVTDPTGAPAALAGRPLTVSLLDPSNDSWALRISGILPAAGAVPWTGTFAFPSGLTGRWTNATVVVENGSNWGVASAAFAPPPRGAPPGPSVWELLIDYQLPLLAGFMILLLAFRFLGDRHRSILKGPSPRELSGEACPPPAKGDAGRTPASSPGPASVSAPPTARYGEVLTPFCWKCGTTLKGNEARCPSCGTQFS
ncbi:MAG: S8 family serine peptidase [Euryarchaeota archaeon]|nr:S8 family serine peptidase [Euryarchaeota archaeon]MDE1879396.1 S8 family serine peptidase [Euryarchaeota archaeon]MDE2044084.1 S8 family serine peptidase [Thermoplasmata archaeon]